jgi:ribonuclease HII
MPGQARSRCRNTFERKAAQQGYRLVAGADEAGRGCLFGPVFAAAVILSPDRPIPGLNDSKQLTAEIRLSLAARIRERALAWSVTAVDAFEIDRINILQASRLAMKQAIESLSPACDYILSDGVSIDLPLPQVAIIEGDARCRSIAAASILAKTERDACLAAWDQVFPGYGLTQNKGYGTPAHLDALRKLGPTPLHRFSFEPVRRYSRPGMPTGLPSQLEMFAAGSDA